ncbi:MAG: T9SS type A sorting domain-containing protein, partial [Bacteroidota bacterium]
TGAIAGTKTYFCDDIAFGFPVSVNSMLGDEMKLSLCKDGIRIFSNTITEVDQVGIFDIMGRSICFIDKKSHVNTLIPVGLNSNTIYIIKIKVNNQIMISKGLLMN